MTSYTSFVVRHSVLFKQIVPLLEPSVSTWFVSHFVSHYSRQCIGRRLYTSSASVSNWERGITTPSRRVTKRIAEFFSYTFTGYRGTDALPLKTRRKQLVYNISITIICSNT
jgi:hypothetical protein